MAAIEAEKLNFTYPDADRAAVFDFQNPHER